MAGQSEILIFSDAAVNFALRLSEVKEIINLRRIVSLPFSAPFLIGLTSVRGTMLPVISPFIFIKGTGSKRYLSDVEYAALVESGGMEIGVACRRILGVKSIDRRVKKPSDRLVEPVTIEGKKIQLIQVDQLIHLASESIVDERYLEVT